MGEKGYMTSEVKVCLDGKEITNFFPAEVRLAEADSEESLQFLKCRFDFDGTITLSRRSMRRLKLLFCKAWFLAWIRGD
jgi:hypothetical protein